MFAIKYGSACPTISFFGNFYEKDKYAFINKIEKNSYNITSANKNLMITSNLSSGSSLVNNVGLRIILLRLDDVEYEDICP